MSVDAASLMLGVGAGAACAAGLLLVWMRGRLKAERERAAGLEGERRQLVAQAETLRTTLGRVEQDRARFETRADRVSELERSLEKRGEVLETLQQETRTLGEETARLKAELDQGRLDATERRGRLSEMEQGLVALRTELQSVGEDRARLAAACEEQGRALAEKTQLLGGKEQEATFLQAEARALAEERARLAAALEEQGRSQAEKEQLLESRSKALDALQTQLGQVRQEAVGLRVELEQERAAAAEKLQLVDRAEQGLREAFQALSAEALKSNNRAFLDLARAQLGEFQQGAKSDLEQRQRAIDKLVSPIEQSLEKVQGAIQGIEKERAAAYGELREQVKGLAVSQQQLQSETANLVKALRTPAIRGRWGEIQLRRVVEMAGMLDHCDFFEQASKETEAGRVRPDLVVRLPGGRQVVVDSKVPLAAYLSSVEATDDAARETFLEEHGRQVRGHMVKLASKGYWEQFNPTPDFVIMFLPGETFFSAALQKDPALIEYGVEQRVIAASPTTLIALLRAVAYGWRQELVAEHARRISELGRELHDRLSVFAGHLGNAGKSLGRAVEAYNDAVGSLERRVLTQARRFKEMGATVAEDLPELPLVTTAPRLMAERPAVVDEDDGGKQ